MFTYIIWRFLILEMFVLGAFCEDTCFYNHPHKQFCTSQFVITLKFHEEIDLPVRYAFRTEIILLYKGMRDELNIKDDRYVNVVTSDDLHFIAGQTYVIFGRNENGNIYTDSCNRNIPREYMRPSYSLRLAVFYQFHCDCDDVMYVGFICQSTTPFVKKRNEDCSWVEPKYVRLCHKGELDYDAWK